jgi:prolyl-tRNA synthetase
VTVAPYQVHLILLRGKGAPQADDIAENLYKDLQAAGIEVLFDDRDDSPGVKFNDADLIGLPLRVTVSERALAQGGVEMKLRSKPDKDVIPLDAAVAGVRSALETLEAGIAARVNPVEYNG